ncbi:IclR family transcriptional regulator [Martelella endophytica]|uniref:IclR family transcriptional regulator n=1 Tax=Martelella endophytica TaxID=1486262 RepID=UPI000B32A8BF|nr:IclR family transcriptional regulator [Martelella endophytica]
MKAKSEGLAADGHSAAMEKNRIPAIDRMMDVLAYLERKPSGASMRELVEVLHLPRTTVYRLLNSLHAYGIVRHLPDGSYVLGTRLISLAARVLPSAADIDIVLLATPHMERLSETTGEGCKLSILTDDGIVVIAASSGSRRHALAGVPGQRFPLHTGAASKVLLASLTKSELDAILPEALARYTARTITSVKNLRSELTRIRRQGWAWDEGEFSTGVNAFAAPVPDRNGKTIAALSLPYLADETNAGRLDMLRAATISTAGAIAADLPSVPTRGATGWNG